MSRSAQVLFAWARRILLEIHKTQTVNYNEVYGENSDKKKNCYIFKTRLGNKKNKKVGGHGILGTVTLCPHADRLQVITISCGSRQLPIAFISLS